MEKEELKVVSVYALILIIVTCLILYIYNPYRIESTIEFNMDRLFNNQKVLEETFMSISEKLEPLSIKQNEIAMGILVVESEDEAMSIIEEIKVISDEMDKIYEKSSEKDEIERIEKSDKQIIREINSKLEELEEERKETILEELSEKHSVDKELLVQVLSSEE